MHSFNSLKKLFNQFQKLNVKAALKAKKNHFKQLVLRMIFKCISII